MIACPRCQKINCAGFCASTRINLAPDSIVIPMTRVRALVASGELTEAAARQLCQPEGHEPPADWLKASAVVWYNKTATDNRVWCVLRGDTTVRARCVEFPTGGSTAFLASGFLELQPGGPRGVIFANSVILTDEVPV